MNKPYIICVDDEPTVLESLLTQLRAHLGTMCLYEGAQSGEEALELLDDIIARGNEVAVFISDQMMPGLKGHELLAIVHSRLPDTVKVLLTGVTTTEELGRAVNEAKIYRYIAKPWEKLDLQMTAEEALKTYLQRREIESYTVTLENLVTASQLMVKENTLESLTMGILKHLQDATGADRGGILIFDGHDPISQLFYDMSKKPFPYTDDREAFPTTLFEVASYCDDTLLILNPDNCSLIKPSYVQQYNPKSICCKPLYHNERLSGVIYLESTRQKNFFHKGRLRFVELLAIDACLNIERIKMILNLERTIADRTAEVSRQKQIIEAKSRDLLDSITYACRLQNSLMEPVEVIRPVFPSAFVYYKPKDIISGDFYWFKETEQHVHFAVVDCTGHGVPGGMLSVMGLNLLNQIVLDQEVHVPGTVLEGLNRHFTTRMGNNSGGQRYYDSMDVALCCFDKHNQQLAFAGAKRPLFLLRGGELIEFKGDNYALGGSPLHSEDAYAFDTKYINMLPGDRVFIFSDGITDQFGGNRDKKYSSRRLRDFLLRTANLPLDDVHSALEQELEDWRGDSDQTDDLLLIGLEFPNDDSKRQAA